MRKRYLPLLLLTLIGFTPTVQAQEEERSREQVRREEAERRVREAQQQIEAALRQLRDEDARAARRDLERAIAQLRAAERELRGQFDAFLSTEGGVRVFAFGDERPQIAVFESDRPRIGVLVQTERDAETDAVGAKIVAVTPGGPADEAGIEPDDIVTEANGVRLATGRRGESPGERLISVVREVEEGDSLLVTYRRGGEEIQAAIVPRTMSGGAFAYSFGDSLEFLESPRFEYRSRITLPEFISPRVQRIDIDPLELVGRLSLHSRWFDVELVSLNEDLGAYFGTSEGLLVIRAPGDEKFGLKSGDVILRIDGRTPTSPSHAVRIMRSYEDGETVTFTIMRNKQRQPIEITVPENQWDFDWPEPRP